MINKDVGTQLLWGGHRAHGGPTKENPESPAVRGEMVMDEIDTCIILCAGGVYVE